MKITALEEYGLRCVLRLAMNHGGNPLTVAEIADQEGLTIPYVGKLMSLLRQSGFVESVRGRSGGYVLTRPATEISVEDVLNCLGEPLFDSNYCESHPGVLAVCSHQGDCSIRSVWQVLGEMIHRVLRGTSLADLCMQEKRLASRFQDEFQPSLMLVGGQGGSCGSVTVPAGAGGVATRGASAGAVSESVATETVPPGVFPGALPGAAQGTRTASDPAGAGAAGKTRP